MTLEIHIWITNSGYAFQGTNRTTELKHKLSQEVCTFQHETTLHKEMICISAVSTRSAYIESLLLIFNNHDLYNTIVSIFQT
jgi:hypothetical protein